MNTTLPVQADVLPIGALVPSPTNPRKRFDPIGLAELKTSVEQHGVLQPLLVRETNRRSDEGSQVYEIIDGERRYRVARESGIPELPIHIIEASDDQVREMQVVMNLQRQDVHPLDEADGYAELQEHLGSLQAIAARVGKDIAYVAGRLKLRALSDLSRQAFTEQLITVDHALLLAKLGAEEQEQALRYTINQGATKREPTEALIVEAAKSKADKGHFGYWEPASPLQVKEFVETHIDLELRRAPWDLADAELLPTAGACTDCPKNTVANTALFGDLAIEKATCMDSLCFNEKRKRFVELKVATTIEAGADVVKISWAFSGAKPRWAKDGSGPDLKTTFKQGQWVEAKKGDCDHIVTAITVDYDRSESSHKPGQKKTVCVAANCKAHKKEYEKAKSQRSGGVAYDPEAERQKEEENRKTAKAETKTRIEHVTAALKKVSKLTPVILREALAQACGDHENPDLRDILGSGYLKKLKTAKPESAEVARILVASLISDDIGVNSYWVGEIPTTRARLLKSLKELTGYVPATEKKPAKVKRIVKRKGKR